MGCGHGCIRQCGARDAGEARGARGHGREAGAGAPDARPGESARVARPAPAYLCEALGTPGRARRGEVLEGSPTGLAAATTAAKSRSQFAARPGGDDEGPGEAPEGPGGLPNC